MDNMKDWTSLPTPEVLTVAFRGKDREKISAESSLVSARGTIRCKD